MLPSPWQPRVAALMSESPPRTLVQAPGQVMRPAAAAAAAAGHVLTPRHKMAALFAPQASRRVYCWHLFLLHSPFVIPMMKKKKRHNPRRNLSIRLCCGSNAVQWVLVGFPVGIKQPSHFSILVIYFFLPLLPLPPSTLKHNSQRLHPFSPSLSLPVSN